MRDIYEIIEGFHEGLACVQRDELYGFIDAKFNEVVPCEYERVSRNGFENGYCGYENGIRYVTKGLIDKNGKELFSIEDSEDVEFDIHLLEYDSEIKGFWYKREGEYGCVNEQGITLIPFVWDEYCKFNNGMAFVKNQAEDAWSVIDVNGDVLISLEGYDGLSWGNDQLIIARKGKKWGCVDKDFHEMVGFKYDKITYIGNDVFVVGNDRRYGLMNSQGELILKCVYKRWWPLKGGSYAILERTDGYVQIFDTKRERMFKGFYKDFSFDNESEDGDYFALLTDSDMWVLLDGNGDVVLELEKEDYDSIGVPHNGLIKVTDENYCGMINLDGNIVIPFIYESLSLPENGLISARFNGDYCVININNELVFANGVNQSEWEQACEEGK